MLILYMNKPCSCFDLDKNSLLDSYIQYCFELRTYFVGFLHALSEASFNFAIPSLVYR